MRANKPLVVATRCSADKNQNKNNNSYEDDTKIFGAESGRGFGGQ